MIGKSLFLSTLVCFTLQATDFTWNTAGPLGIWDNNASWLCPGPCGTFPNSNNDVAFFAAQPNGVISISSAIPITMRFIGVSNVNNDITLNLFDTFTFDSGNPNPNVNAVLLVSDGASVHFANTAANQALAWTTPFIITSQRDQSIIELSRPLINGVNGPKTFFIAGRATVRINNTNVAPLNSFTGLTDVLNGILDLASTGGPSLIGDVLIEQFGKLTITNGINQFGPTTTNITIDHGLAITNGNQSFNSLTVTERGFWTGDILTLNSTDCALRMAGSILQINDLIFPNGGSICYDTNLGSGAAFITANSPGALMVNGNGNPITFHIDSGANPLFDMLFENAVFQNTDLTKLGPGTLLLSGSLEQLVHMNIDEGRVLIGRTKADIVDEAFGIDIHPGGILGGFGTLGISGDAVVNNSGILEPGSELDIGTLTISGTYNQSPQGTLLIKAQDINHTDLLVVNQGGVNLAGTLSIQAGNANFTPGQTVLIVDNSLGTGITGAFTRLIEQLPSDFIAAVIQTPNQIFLEFATSPVVEDDELFAGDFSTISMTSERSLYLTRRLRSVRNRFYKKSPPVNVNTAELTASNDEEMLPLKKYRARDAVIVQDETLENLRNREIQQQQIQASRFRKKMEQPASIYVTPLGSWGGVDEHKCMDGFDFSSFGGLIGSDYAFSRAGVGAHVGYENLHGNIKHTGTFRVKSAFGEVYGTFLPLPDRNFFLDLFGGGSRNWYTFTRCDVLGEAKGKPKGWEYDVYGGVGYDIKLGSSRITPLASVQYIHVEVDGFKEKACHCDIFKVCEQKFHSLRSWLGLSAGTKITRKSVILLPEIRGFWQHEFANQNHHVGVTSLLINSTSQVQLFGGSKNYGVIGAELRALCGEYKNWTIAGGYDYQWNNISHANYMYGEIGYNF